MKKIIFGALALALISFTSCRNEENTEVTAEPNSETAINQEVKSEMMTEELEDSIEVETEEAVDSLETTDQAEQASSQIQ
ncbi:hypothetical protein GCM10023115_32530 [Pontixanthobacter gangjinensis]|uniref:Uncharacterized protein n=1 Tax=Christiangramia aestuarii TaxID=1028746 RepID=A0A7K1LST5_9FLAO|nr:hypothetical protein [Christiangramia aestuarii]MUP43671.1 hypothetical protein [Christiangramia aestuarii]